MRTKGLTAFDLAKGEAGVLAMQYKFGFSALVTSGAYSDVWDRGGVMSYFSTATAVTVIGATTTDINTTTATGARSVSIEGLDANWEVQTETIAMNGTSTAAAVNTYRRVYRAHVNSSGSLLTNDGNITVNGTDASVGVTAMAFIPADLGQTFQTQYTVPANKLLTLAAFYAESGASNDEARIELQSRPSTDNAFRSKWEAFVYRGAASHPYIWAVQCPAKTDLRIQAKNLAVGTMNVSAKYVFVLEDVSV